MDMSNSSWVPDEDAQTLFSERSWLQGALVSTLAYGVTVCLYFMTFRQLIRSRDRKKSLPLLIYITVVFCLGTIFMVSLAAFTQMAFIDDRNFPGGPSAFENDEFSIPLDDMGNAAFNISNWLCDALMVWRFKVIYQTSRFPIWALVSFPCLMLLGSVVLGILFLNQVSTTNAYMTSGVNFTLPYLGVSLALNMLLTVLIVARLLSFRHRIAVLLGPNYGKQYTSVAAIMVESVAPYSLISLAFLVLFGIGSAVSEVLLQSLSQIQIAATLLIVFRIAQGKGWTTETANRVTTQIETVHKMQFTTLGASGTLAGPGELETEEAEKKEKMNEQSEESLGITEDVFTRGAGGET